MKGSSPLTRGKRRERERDVLPDGLIPAHAGKTVSRPARISAWRAHPRSRGENGLLILIALVVVGSSPLTRGKPGPVRRAGGDGGLIPAHAGKTPSRWRARAASAAHPRSRGENAIDSGTGTVRGGSSPLTRGKLTMSLKLSIVHGLIPAHAGKTIARYRSVVCGEAHPRSRGENSAST